ncbi:MAG: hypothetical protein IPL55_14745 [Saprospiraceae bacterium]|jgi:hypothetical protein|nr:hypothetical protein [Saprospiraceae bacterium]
MLKQWIFLILVALMVPGCKQKPPDGNYCAKVLYQNPDTKKQSSYTLIVEVKDNKLTDISFPEEHYDQSEITAVEIPKDGKVTVVSKSGNVYKVEMKGPAEECMKAVNMVQCKGKSKSGSRCKRYTGNKSGFCWQHVDQKSG